MPEDDGEDARGPQEVHRTISRRGRRRRELAEPRPTRDVTTSSGFHLRHGYSRDPFDASLAGESYGFERGGDSRRGKRSAPRERVGFFLHLAPLFEKRDELVGGKRPGEVETLPEG